MSSSHGASVGMVGATSLEGRELTKILGERNFPVQTLVAIEPGKRALEIPVLDLESNSLQSVQIDEVKGDDFDFIFVASPLSSEDWTLLTAQLRDGSGSAATPGPVIVSLAHPQAEAGNAIFCAPGRCIPTTRSGANESILLSCPHAASVALSTLLLRLAAHFKVQRAVANIFAPASNLGPAAIDELQEQTLKLLSFQKIPQAVFGSQMAFNLLPRIGGGARGILTELETDLRQELKLLLAGVVPVPAIRVVQVPVFYSTALSLYVGTDSKVEAARASKAIDGKGVQLRRLTQPAATPIESVGSADILVDVVLPDGSEDSGLWLWAAVDDLRLAAKSAVEVAEQFLKKAILH
jgi:aspartate-semialdehyde dehydrogenase